MGISHEFGTSVTSFYNLERESKISNRFALKIATVALVMQLLALKRMQFFFVCKPAAPLLERYMIEDVWSVF